MAIFHSYVKLPEGTSIYLIATSLRPHWKSGLKWFEPPQRYAEPPKWGNMGWRLALFNELVAGQIRRERVRTIVSSSFSLSAVCSWFQAVRSVRDSLILFNIYPFFRLGLGRTWGIRLRTLVPWLRGLVPWALAMACYGSPGRPEGQEPVNWLHYKPGYDTWQILATALRLRFFSFWYVLWLFACSLGINKAVSEPFCITTVMPNMPIPFTSPSPPSPPSSPSNHFNYTRKIL